MATVLESAEPEPRLRRRFLVLLALVLFLAGTAAMSTPALLGSRVLAAPNEARISAAEALLTNLPPPAGTRRDPYSTACGLPAALCLTSVSLPADKLIDVAIDALVQAGASEGTRGCGSADEVSSPGRCTARLAHRGVGLQVLADERTGPGLIRQQATWLAVLVAGSEPVPDAAAALPRMSSLGILPSRWRVEPACSAPAPDGCLRYSATFSVSGEVARAYAELRQQLVAGRYLIDRDRCRLDPARGTVCLIAATRFRSVGGRDGVLVTGALQAAGRDSVQVRMTASAL